MQHSLVWERYEPGKEKDIQGFFYCTVECHVVWYFQLNLPGIGEENKTIVFLCS